jgi:peptidoglycan/xylan/chitin deacetylase (PgdA/CDA1 family)
MDTISRLRKNSIILVIFLLTFLTVVPSTLAAPSVWINKVNTSERVIALTIDDGSDGGNYARILNVLDKHNVKATFFLTGAGAQNHPQRIRDTAARGHGLGNHSFDHPNFTEISASARTSQLSRTETIVRNLTGKSTKPYFRAPYGATNSSVLNTVGNAGYTYTLHWSIDTLDWTGNSATTIYNRVMNGLEPGAIILAHTGAGASGTVAAMDRYIPAIKSRGYRFVTIAELMRIRAGTNTTTRTYTVRAGDTLYSIARRFNTTVSRLASLNNLSNVNVIRVGQVLRVPGAAPAPAPAPTPATRNYTVRAGDTLSTIARRHNTTVARLAQLNNLTNVNLIRVGQVLRVPGTAASTPAPSQPATYTVRAGDTLYSIARRHNTTVSRLASLNNIRNVSLIRVGQVLRVR